MGRVERYNRNSKEQRLRWTDIQDAAAIAPFTMSSVRIEHWVT